MATPTPFFSWQQEYCLGNEAIDRQHEHLAELVGKLYESVMARESKQVRAERLKAFYDCAKSHFSSEEQLLRIHQYPKYLVHKAAHEGLALALSGLREEVVSGERELSVEYVELVKLWIVDHFFEFDRAYRALLPEVKGNADTERATQTTTKR
jgi:hemerythrin-like metal-binding protein